MKTNREELVSQMRETYKNKATNFNVVWIRRARFDGKDWTLAISAGSNILK
jgi:hypothetical protein